jgi:hypothetical protein
MDSTHSTQTSITIRGHWCTQSARNRRGSYDLNHNTDQECAEKVDIGVRMEISRIEHPPVGLSFFPSLHPGLAMRSISI